MVLDNSIRHQVNGSLLPQYQGKPISIFGDVLKTDASGRSFDMKSSDNMVISINMSQPLTEPISGLVEVIGTVQGKNTIMCDSYIQFPEDLARTYDPEIDNAAVTYISNTENPWK